MQSSSNEEMRSILQQHLGESVDIHNVSTVGGGCIHQANVLTLSNGQRYFLKRNQAHWLELFSAEADGLQALRATQTLRVPEPLGYGVVAQQAYVLLEYLPLQAHGDQRLAGEQLAALHRHTARYHGWWRDNVIGATLQRNTQHADWVAFWREQRLGVQLQLAQRNGYPRQAYEQGLRLQEKLAVFFSDYQPAPSLLHGDLWGGNLAYLPDGSPVIFDPAVYYGDRETDLAMTALFGGFSAEFYAVYNAAWAVDAGYKVRKTLYNLYHILNHFNLFGGGYAQQAARMTAQLLALS